MSNNKSNSPFFAIGQGINQLLDYRMIARAGAPRNFLGTAIGAVGSLVSRLDFSEMMKSDNEKSDDTEKDETQKALDTLMDGINEGLEDEKITEIVEVEDYEDEEYAESLLDDILKMQQIGK